MVLLFTIDYNMKIIKVKVKNENSLKSFSPEYGDLYTDGEFLYFGDNNNKSKKTISSIIMDSAPMTLQKGIYALHDEDFYIGDQNNQAYQLNRPLLPIVLNSTKDDGKPGDSWLYTNDAIQDSFLTDYNYIVTDIGNGIKDYKTKNKKSFVSIGGASILSILDTQPIGNNYFSPYNGFYYNYNIHTPPAIKHKDYLFEGSDNTQFSGNSIKVFRPNLPGRYFIKAMATATPLRSTDYNFGNLTASPDNNMICRIKMDKNGILYKEIKQFFQGFKAYTRPPHSFWAPASGACILESFIFMNGTTDFCTFSVALYPISMPSGTANSYKTGASSITIDIYGPIT